MKFKNVAMVLSTTAFLAIAGQQGHLNQSQMNRAPASAQQLTNSNQEPEPNTDLVQKSTVGKVELIDNNFFAMRHGVYGNYTVSSPPITLEIKEGAGSSESPYQISLPILNGEKAQSLTETESLKIPSLNQLPGDPTGLQFVVTVKPNDTEKTKIYAAISENETGAEGQTYQLLDIGQGHEFDARAFTSSTSIDGDVSSPTVLKIDLTNFCKSTLECSEIKDGNSLKREVVIFTTSNDSTISSTDPITKDQITNGAFIDLSIKDITLKENFSTNYWADQKNNEVQAIVEKTENQEPDTPTLAVSQPDDLLINELNEIVVEAKRIELDIPKREVATVDAAIVNDETGVDKEEEVVTQTQDLVHQDEVQKEKQKESQQEEIAQTEFSPKFTEVNNESKLVLNTQPEAEEIVVAEVVKDETAEEVVKDKTLAEVVKDETVAEVVKDKTTEEVVKDKTTEEVVKDETAEEVAKDETAEEVAKDETAEEIAKDETAEEIAKDETTEEVATDTKDMNQEALAQEVERLKLLIEETTKKSNEEIARTCDLLKEAQAKVVDVDSLLKDVSGLVEQHFISPWAKQQSQMDPMQMMLMISMLNGQQNQSALYTGPSQVNPYMFMMQMMQENRQQNQYMDLFKGQYEIKMDMLRYDSALQQRNSIFDYRFDQLQSGLQDLRNYRQPAALPWLTRGVNFSNGSFLQPPIY